MNKRQLIIFVIIALLCVLQSGCALLQIPIKILDIVGNVVKGTFGVIQRMPMPPPGVF